MAQGEKDFLSHTFCQYCSKIRQYLQHFLTSSSFDLMGNVMHTLNWETRVLLATKRGLPRVMGSFYF